MKEEIEDTEDIEIENEEENKRKKTENAFFKKPEIIKRVLVLYEQYGDYQKITDIINKEYNKSACLATIRRCYVKNKKKAFIMDETNTEFFENSFEETKKRWKESWDMMSWLSKQVKDFQVMLDKEEKNKRVLIAIKSIPSLVQLSQAIIKQLEYIRNEQENIKINQKNFIYSPIQLNLEMKKYKNIFIKEYLEQKEKEGVIEIKSDLPEIELKKKKIEVEND